MVREKESRGRWDDPEALKQVTITEAVTTFLQAIAPNNTAKAKSTTRKIRVLFQGVDPDWALKADKAERRYSSGLMDFCRDKGLTVVSQLTLPVLTDYTAEWTCGALHRRKRLQLLSRFFQFSMAAGWCEGNPAKELQRLERGRTKADRVKPTMPFDGATLPEPGAEWKALLDEVRKHPKLLAITLLMRYAGLRISDAACFNQSRILADGSIFLYTHKTTEPVTIPMHPELKEALGQIVPNASGYYFWTGESAVMTAADNWRVRFQKAFVRACIQNGHPHRLRDTFAVDLLLRGVSIDQVSLLLGHSSIKVTEQHYLAFVKARRKQLSEAVLLAWGQRRAEP
jgi:integrase